MHPWVWGRMRLYGVQGTQSVRADDEPETRLIIGEEGSTLRLTTTERRLKPRTSPESQPRLGFTGASKNSAHRVFFAFRVLMFHHLFGASPFTKNGQDTPLQSGPDGNGTSGRAFFGNHIYQLRTP